MATLLGLIMEGKQIAKRLEVNGIVQGVGFRPFVYQLANRHRIKGDVANTCSGVSMHIEGTGEDIDAFCSDLSEKTPPLAQVTEISAHSRTVKGCKIFSIEKSRCESHRSTLISPDVSVCEDCLRELFDPEDRRFQYPFINCTNCGPRYTIIADIPYDRPSTSMKYFKMCPECQAEYNDPENRRFHAQPNACDLCGPHVSLCDNTGNTLLCPKPIEEAAALLHQGYIIAIKGLGGFHLAADADNSDAVVRLRNRKHREEKPFALMSCSLWDIRKYAVIEPEDEALLSSPQRPIVIVKKKAPNTISEAVAPGNRYFGTMLPYTPLHYLLLQYGFTALVMTSGNISEEPIVMDNEEAFARLSGIADYFLIHNRDIYQRSDDSIVSRSAGAARFIRRSRGFVPRPVFLKKRVPQILACGAELKNTICLTKGDKAFLSQYIGDLETDSTYRFFRRTIEHLKQLVDIQPEIVACDLHPDYLSTRYAEEQLGVKRISIQHHHAHVVSCMAENMLAGPAIGLSFDGTGYGTDGSLWGGEVLVADAEGFSRAAQLSYVPMPGGSAAIKEPWRMAISYLYDAFGEAFRDLDLPVLRKIDEKRTDIIVEMISKNVNCPNTSSVGRLFDGVASILGLRNQVCYEGQAAMELEMLAGLKTARAYGYEWTSGDIHHVVLEPVIRGIVRDMEKGVDTAHISSRFHVTLICLFSELCDLIRLETGLNQVVLSGGVFQNAFLLSGLTHALEEKNFEVFSHRLVPANDGGICLGQAVAAGAMAGR